ncbi:hypothetical protein [Enterococcus phoeniculicola]|uniref:Uncharacterized protein n=1 Tax=Enterococcus phoeniculicola ATCC BAA-412 TaxID=1158610 RepID=R3TLY7_9ENTE|nr:hypothetical protein [Enterococcus phoeniculicola]EOL42018.1 hypothetical protein UC3_02366 [Enterococcus phoeniculicola ATCC BAA-412]EOT79703.1 hypothetical protein I589_01215 [Enterococcus phoeniculicola ATCC BAA-412]
MINSNLLKKQKNETFMLESYVIPFLNQFEVLDSSVTGGELEYVLISETAENVQKLNEFLCTVNCWAMISPRFLCPTMSEYLTYCRMEDAGTLDLAYLVYNFLNINTDYLWFGTAERKWILSDDEQEGETE